MVSFPSGLLSKCRYSVMSFFVLELARKMWEQPEKSGIVLYCISHEGIFWEKLGMAVIIVISGFVVYTRLLGHFPLY